MVRRNKWMRFSIRTFMLLVAGAGLLAGWFGTKIYEAGNQRVAREAIEQLNGWFAHDYALNNRGDRSGSESSIVPEWLRPHVGDDLLHPIQDVALGDIQQGRQTVTDEDLRRVTEHLPKLRGLYIYRTQITDDGLSPIQRLSGLHYLSLYRNQHISPEGLSALAPLQRLHTLEVYGNYNDDALNHISRLAGLRELNFESSCTDVGLQHLSRLQHIESLSLDGGLGITDVGLKELAKMTTLTQLELESPTSATTEGIAELKRALPACEITIRGEPTLDAS